MFVAQHYSLYKTMYVNLLGKSGEISIRDNVM